MPFGDISVLISAAWLNRHIHDAHLVVIDCRWRLNDPGFGEKAYAAAHIPGAQRLDLDRDLSAPKSHYGGRHPLPDPMSFERSMSTRGIGPDTYVIAYDDDAAGAARLWWCLSYYGHTRVSILDGGITAWVGAGLPLSTDAARPTPPSKFVAHPDPRMTVDYQTVATVSSRLTLIDVRNPERFSGTVEPVDTRAGHIPGAMNIPYATLLESNGQYHHPSTLRQMLAPVLEETSQPVVYCGSGVTACIGVAALRQIGGDPLLYPGSWSDWIQHAGAPIAGPS